MVTTVANHIGAELLTKKSLTVAIHAGRCPGAREFAGVLADKINKSKFPCHTITAKKTSEIVDGAGLNCRSAVRQALAGKRVDFIIDFEVGKEFAVFSNIYSFDRVNAALIGNAIQLMMCSKPPKLAEIEPLPALREKLREIVKGIWKNEEMRDAIMGQIDTALVNYKTNCLAGPALAAMEHNLDAFMYAGQKEKVVEFYGLANPLIDQFEKGALLYSGRLMGGENGKGRKRAVLIEAPAPWLTTLADRLGDGIIMGMQSVLGSPCK